MRRRLGGKLELFRQQMGFTFLEVLIATVLLGVVGVSLLTALNTNARATRTLEEQVVGGNLAAEYLEAIKNSPYAATYPNAGENITVPFQYNVVIKTECSIDGTTFDNCTGSANETLQKITTTVLREGRPVLALCTYRAKR